MSVLESFEVQFHWAFTGLERGKQIAFYKIIIFTISIW